MLERSFWDFLQRQEVKNSLKVERAKMNVTQAELAKEIEVSRQTINSIELGRFVPSTLLALKIAKYFKCSVEEIFVLEEKDFKN